MQRGGGLGGLVGWSLLAGLVRPVPVTVIGVLAQDRSQVLFVTFLPTAAVLTGQDAT